MHTVIVRLIFMDVLYDGKIVGLIEKVQRTASVFITGTMLERLHKHTYAKLKNTEDLIILLK